jgi:hypothetical protein
MVTKASYLPKYAESRALVIGIDKYKHVSPLIHAGNDARAVAEALVDRFAFPRPNVKLLVDASATRSAILNAFLSYADISNAGPDDRLLVFFAGHGHTISGRRGETGFLVPVDGKAEEIATLIRWDELTRNADLISAKHILFLMDACYGGLALTRTTIPPGSMRFLKDMLQRYARQVLTAGKADEEVSDGGGTRQGHSIFTSYLLDGLEGAAAPAGGIITGHGLMAYIYDRVGSDSQSRQTPHFGFFDGDGDFIFDTSALARLASEPSSEPDPDLDVFIKSPAFVPVVDAKQESISDILKRLIAVPSEKIRLNDFVFALLRRAEEQLSQDKFPTTGPQANEEFSSRVQRYEESIADLARTVVLLAQYAEPEQIILLERIFTGISEFDKPQAGSVLWIKLNWYPVLMLMYAAGIAALATDRFSTFRAAVLTPVYAPQPLSGQETSPIVLPVISELTEIAEAFKSLPDMERKYVPRSEHLYKKLQPMLEDELFLGRRYELLFDQFEMFLALSFADLRDDDPESHVWGPPGRFAWKQRRHQSVYTNFVNGAKAQGDHWGPLKVGFFRGSAKRFSNVADAYGRLLAQIAWW